MDNLIWPDDDTVEWLTPMDFLVSLAVTRAIPRRPARVLELGVWKGGWSVTLVRNSDAEVVGIDNYPGNAAPARDQLLESLNHYGISDRFTLKESWSDLRSDEEFDLIHLDGEHSEAALTLDLDEATKVLADRGVIIIDDIIHAYFPGVASAAHAFFRDRGYRPFFYTSNKAYCTREQDHGFWYDQMRTRLAETSLIVERHHGDIAKEFAYMQAPDVLGLPVLLCVAPENWALAMESFSTPPELEPVRVRNPRLRAFARDWMPPVLHRAIRRLGRQSSQ